jgi:glyoxylase-like metal-dependent hydrolase (beta-lactamase superfamily II)
MKISALQVGELATNCYVVWDETTQNAAIIDPGDSGKYLLHMLSEQGLTLRMILLTHAHFDHIGGIRELLAGGSVPIYVHKDEFGYDNSMSQGMLDESWEYRYCEEGDEITLDSLTFNVLHTPGHTPGSVCYLCGDILFSGDTLFQGSCGRTDFPGGSWEKINESLRRLYHLDGDYTVLSGHTGATTLERERKTNFFMVQAVSEE